VKRRGREKEGGMGGGRKVTDLVTSVKGGLGEEGVNLRGCGGGWCGCPVHRKKGVSQVLSRNSEGRGGGGGVSGPIKL